MSHPNFLSKLLNLVHIHMACHSKLHFVEQIAYLVEMWYFIELLLLLCMRVQLRQPLTGWNNPKFFTVCKVWSRVSEAVLLALRTLSLSFVTITLPQTVRLFYVSLRSQAPPQQYTVLSFSSMRRHGHSRSQINWPLHGITLWPYLSQTHRPNLWYCTVGIPFWTCRKRQSQTSKFDGKTTIPRDPSYVSHICRYVYTCYGEVDSIR